MVCYGMLWYGTVWYGMVWYGMVVNGENEEGGVTRGLHQEQQVKPVRFLHGPSPSDVRQQPLPPINKDT